jgi:hypothetical protein
MLIITSPGQNRHHLQRNITFMLIITSPGQNRHHLQRVGGACVKRCRFLRRQGLRQSSAGRPESRYGCPDRESPALRMCAARGEPEEQVRFIERFKEQP